MISSGNRYLPNSLTVLRIILTFVFMTFVFIPGVVPRALALFVFTIASLSDFYDGRLARKYNIISDFGKLMDPIADKILVLGAFLAFVQLQLVSAWMVIVIILRESFISGLRLIALKKRKVIAAAEAGKQKTVSQMATIFIVLIILLAKEILLRRGLWGVLWTKTTFWSINILMTITLLLTIVSAISFISKNRYLLMTK